MKCTTDSSSPGEISFIEQFMQYYKSGSHSLKSNARRAAELCSDALNQMNVPHKVEYHVKEDARLKAELSVREQVRGSPYKTVQEIEIDVIDLIGICVTVHSYHDHRNVRDIVAKHFDVCSDPWEGQENDSEELERTRYGSDHYWVKLKAEREGEEPASGFIEIQVKMTKSEGSLDIIYEHFVNQRIMSDEPLRSQLELEIFLWRYVPEKGQEQDQDQDESLLGDVQPLWRLMQILDLRRPRKLREILRKASVNLEIESRYHLSQEFEFVSLPLSIATYMIDSIFQSPELGVNKIIHDRVETKSGKDLQRYKISVLKDSFVWLGHLFSKTEWVGMLIADFDHDIQRLKGRSIAWLIKRSTRNFYEGSELKESLSYNDESSLDDLWFLFLNNGKFPIYYAFSLARLGVRGSWSSNWSAVHDVVHHVLEPDCLRMDIF